MEGERLKGEHCFRGKPSGHVERRSLKRKQAVLFPPSVHDMICQLAEHNNRSFSAQVVHMLLNNDNAEQSNA